MFAAIDRSLGSLKMRQRKNMIAALENQLAQCKRNDLPVYFDVEGGWPPVSANSTSS